MPVGFGLDLAALAPVALAVSSAVVGFLVDLFRDAAADAASPALADILRRVLRLPGGNDGGAREDAVGALTAGQAARVLDVATRQGAALGLEPEAASLLAHAIVGALAVEPAH